jgi:hypothetical protein
MTERMTKPARKPFANKAKTPWVAPRVDKIDAGQAEVFTRVAADGPFSSS